MTKLTETILKGGGGNTKDKKYFSFTTEKEMNEKKRELERLGYKVYSGNYQAICGIVYYLYY